MLFRKQVYNKIGGHQAKFDHAVEDVALAKLIKKHGGRWRLYDGVNLITSRMYESFIEAYQGFTKNYFGLFNYRLLVALFVWCWMGLITFYPIAIIISAIVKSNYNHAFWFSTIAVTLTVFLWLITSLKFKFPKRIIFYYPAIILVAITIGLHSIILTISGKTSWKDRKIRRRKFRLI